MAEPTLRQNGNRGVWREVVPVRLVLTSRSGGEILLVGKTELADEAQISHNSNYIRLI